MADLTVLWRSVCFFVVTNWFLCTDAANDDTMIVLCSCGIPPNTFSVIPEFVRILPSIPVTILFGSSGFDDAVGCAEAASSDDNQ